MNVGLEVRVPNRSAMESSIDAAVNQLIHLAMANGERGILVTRTSDDRFTLTLSDLVPYGYTEERDARVN